MGSCVGPAVTTTWRPLSGKAVISFAPDGPAGSGTIVSPSSASSIAAMISSGSAMRPGPNSPQAISPSFGPTTKTPSAFSVMRLRRVAA